MKVKMLINWEDRHAGTEQEIQDFLEKSFKQDIWNFQEEVQDIFDNYNIEEIFNMLSKENKTKIMAEVINETIYDCYDEIEVEV